MRAIEFARIKSEALKNKVSINKLIKKKLLESKW